MKTVFFVLFAMTLALFLFLPFSPGVKGAYISSLEPKQGPVGQTVILKGSITCAGEYQVYWDSVAPANLLAYGKLTGCTVTIEIKIPEATKGKHRIILRDVVVGPSADASHDFIVLPSLAASALSGTTGTAINITGTGFAAKEDIVVTYDGMTVKGAITADAKGRWSTTFNIPESARGEHKIQASGSVTTAAEVSPILFTVVPKLNVEPKQGGTGMVVTATGTGFGAEEENIEITFDGLPVKTGVIADKNGSFGATFTVPIAVKGEHTIDASGTVTTNAEVSNVVFTVGPSLIIQPTAGHVGEQVTVMGSGFAANERVKISYDQTGVIGDIITDANGAWTAIFAIPASSAGDHRVTARGTVTPGETVVSPSFTVLPHLVISPISGEVGTQIVLNGTGFAASQPVTVMYDDIKLALDIATDANGSFTATFKAPAAFGKVHEVSAKDNAGNQMMVTFTTEATPPPIPTPVFPSAGTKIGFVGKKIITFQWSEVTDPSGVSYTFEIGNQASPENPILSYRGLIKPEYTLTKSEALDYGKYYWRVKAVDGAGNESDWTAVQPFDINRLKTNVFLIIIGVVAILALLTIWRIVTISRRGGWSEEY